MLKIGQRLPDDLAGKMYVATLPFVEYGINGVCYDLSWYWLGIEREIDYVKMIENRNGIQKNLRKVTSEVIREVVGRETIKEARMWAGLSRPEMSRIFNIPIRTLEDWEAGRRTPPAWAEKLVVEKLHNIAEEAAGR